MADHLSRDQLLRFFDDELSEPGSRKAAEHLDNCEICTLEFGRLKAHLATIAEAEVHVLQASIPEPPTPWPSLEPRLEALAATGNRRQWRGILRPFQVIWRLPFAYGGAALALVLIALLIWGPLQPLSAKEVLDRAAKADRARLAITPQEVVRQRVRVTVKDRSSAASSTRFESWKSPKSGYWNTGDDPLSADLHNRYAANGLALDLPLSPPALEAWVKLAGAEPTASRDGENIQVQVTANDQGRAHGLEQCSFRVQTHTWHVDEMELAFQDATFQIEEEGSSVLDDREVPTDILAKLEPVERKPANPEIPRIETTPRDVRSPQDLDDLEMSVRYDLHKAGADLGSGIEIKQRAPDKLIVNAWGSSPQNKEQLTALLANKPGVQLEFQAPAGDRSSRTNITPVPQSAAQPQDDRLLAFFGGSDAQENYTRGVLETSTDILAHLYALKELAARWPPGSDSDLSPAAKNQLAAIIRDHANAVHEAASKLKPQADFLLKGFNREGINETLSTNTSNWQAATAYTLDRARMVDHLLRSFLTTSDTPMSLDEALPKLKQSVEDLESSAQQLVKSAP